MAEKTKITFINPDTDREKTVVHFVSPDCGDYSLCGVDIAGDIGYDDGKPTNETANCRQCVELVLFCKAIKRSEYTTSKSKLRNTHR